MGIKVSSGEGGSRGIVCAINIASDPSCICLGDRWKQCCAYKFCIFNTICLN